MSIDPQQLEEIVRAVRKAPREEQGKLVELLCRGDDSLRKLVISLIQDDATKASSAPQSSSKEDAVTFDLEDSPADSGRSQELTVDYESSQQVISDRYTLQSRIGEGGMGEVWLAQQLEPVRRRVALKLIKTGMDSKAVLQRFEQERQALAVMDHPNIAKVFDAGRTETGNPFFVMEYVDGLPLSDYCDQAKLSPDDRLKLFLPICKAVQHAHHKGIVHRDLKPANILVTEIDGKPVPKVIDFGVAKAVNASLTPDALTTSIGSVVGTLEYMAPEQAGTDQRDIDTRADIYSLGVILYELLTGLRPFEAKTLRQAALDEVLRVIREDNPVRPSTRLSTSESLPNLAAVRQVEPKRLMAQLRGELDWIVMKCLEKERNRRYETANGLGRDIERYLQGEPVDARPPSRGYRMQKFIKRHRGVVVSVTLLALALLGGIVGTSIGLWTANRETERANLAAADALDARRIAEEHQKTAELANRQAMSALESFTSELMQKLLGGKGELTDNEKSILQSAQQQWDVFAQAQGETVNAREIRAIAARNLAVIQFKLGLDADADQNDAKFVELTRKLNKDDPGNEHFRSLLANALHNRGASLRQFGKREEAGAHFREAVATLEDLAEAYPGNDAYQIRLIRSLNSSGNAARDLGEWENAEEYYQRALQVSETLVTRDPESEKFQDGVASSHWSLAYLNKQLARYSESEGHYLKAIAIFESLANKPGVDPYEYHVLLGSLYREIGVMFFDRQDDEASLPYLERCVEHLRLVAQQYPSIPSHQNDLAKSQRELARTLTYLGRATEAESRFAEAEKILEQLAEAHPTTIVYRLEQALTYRFNAELLERQDQPQEALRFYDRATEILKLAHAQDRNYKNVSRALLRCLISRSVLLTELENYEQARKDQDAALELAEGNDIQTIKLDRLDTDTRAKIEGTANQLLEWANDLGPQSKRQLSTHQLVQLAGILSLASTIWPDRADELLLAAKRTLLDAIKQGVKLTERQLASRHFKPLSEDPEILKALQP